MSFLTLHSVGPSKSPDFNALQEPYRGKNKRDKLSILRREREREETERCTEKQLVRVGCAVHSSGRIPGSRVQDGDQ